MKLIDTTIAVDHLRGEPAAVELLASLVDDGEDLAASELVRFELLAGTRDKEVRALEEFCSALQWANVTEDIARVGDNSPVGTERAIAVSVPSTT